MISIFLNNFLGEDADAPIPWQVSLQKNGGHFCGGLYSIFDSAFCLLKYKV